MRKKKCSECGEEFTPEEPPAVCDSCWGEYQKGFRHERADAIERAYKKVKYSKWDRRGAPERGKQRWTKTGEAGGVFIEFCIDFDMGPKIACVTLKFYDKSGSCESVATRSVALRTAHERVARDRCRDLFLKECSLYAGVKV